MIRVFLLTVVPFCTPAIVYILWRTFAPESWGGSSAIAKDEWEPLPWRKLIPAGLVMVALAVGATILFPDLLTG